jgi:hypothetical protein
MRTLLIGLVLLALTATASAQTDAADAVRATIDRLFDGMRAGDSTALDTRTDDDFVAAVGAPRDATWDERIWDVQIQVDGPMAIARTPYAFYLGDALSHCGVNAFHLVRRGSAWRILQITYTRVPADDCEIPDDVRKR